MACIAATAFWLRSYSHCDVLIGQHSPRDRYEMTLEFGLLTFEHEDAQRGQVESGWQYFEKSLPRRALRPRGLFGFEFYQGQVRHYVLLPSSRFWGVTMPLWFIAAMFGVLPAIQWGRIHRARIARRRASAGLCAACGYDLRASSGRCPECGLLTV
ncbi:MAG TPA: hypothetical protein VH370_07430 [Humisphaera sp.]|nr:hypothetical protein [Humisphaera sp.]